MANEWNNKPKFVVVVGASAGGFNSIIELIAQLTPEMDVAVLFVLHISTLTQSDIVLQRLQKSSLYRCKIAEQDERLQAHHVYMAVPDKHLLIKDNKISLGLGPAENRWRPSIDVLFRSAAAAFDGHVIGIILSGLLQDGTAGMQAIKRSGGTCIVQEPTEAEYPDMPLSVLNAIDVDYCVPLAQMGAILSEKTKNGDLSRYPVPQDIVLEAEIAERMAVGINNVKQLGHKSLFACPDCGGGLWEINQGNVLRYRCHIGHAYTEKELLIRQNEALENTLWVALRMMEERKTLLHKMSDEEASKGWMRSASNKKERANDLEVHITRLKQLLFESKMDKQKEL